MPMSHLGDYRRQQATRLSAHGRRGVAVQNEKVVEFKEK